MRQRVALFAFLFAIRLFASEPAQQDKGPIFDPNQKALRSLTVASSQNG